MISLQGGGTIRWGFLLLGLCLWLGPAIPGHAQGTRFIQRPSIQQRPAEEPPAPAPVRAPAAVSPPDVIATVPETPAPSDTPVLLVLLDTSRSMATRDPQPSRPTGPTRDASPVVGPSRLTLAVEALTSLLVRLPASTAVLVWHFDGRARPINVAGRPLQRPLPLRTLAARQALIDALEQLKPRGQTQLYAALQSALTRLGEADIQHLLHARAGSRASAGVSSPGAEPAEATSSRAGSSKEASQAAYPRAAYPRAALLLLTDGEESARGRVRLEDVQQQREASPHLRLDVIGYRLTTQDAAWKRLCQLASSPARCVAAPGASSLLEALTRFYLRPA